MKLKDYLFLAIIATLLIWGITKPTTIVNEDTHVRDSLELVIESQVDTIAKYSVRSDSVASLLLLERQRRDTIKQELNALNQAYESLIKDINDNSVDDDIIFFRTEYELSKSNGDLR